MVLGLGDRDYDEVVKANNKLRAEMEKLRLENALLKDQIRAITALPPELSSLYVFVQLKMSATVADAKSSPKFASVDETEIASRMGRLVGMGLFETTEKDGRIYYSIKTPDMSEVWAPKPDGKVESPKVANNEPSWI